MKNADEFIVIEDDVDDDLLDFEFDELLEGDLDGEEAALSSDDEVIDLTDVVEEEGDLNDLDSEEMSISLDEDKPLERDSDDKAPDFLSADLEPAEQSDIVMEIKDSDLEDLVEEEAAKEPGVEDEMLVEVDDLTQEFTPEDLEAASDEMEISQEVKEEGVAAADLEDHMEVAVDDLTKEFSSEDLKFESEKMTVSKEMEDEVDALTREFSAGDLKAESEGIEISQSPAETEDIGPEMEDSAEAELPDETAKETVHEVEPEIRAATELQPRPDVDVTVANVVSMGISEERLEAVVRKVVEEVVERVARETMANVAERVFGEAIDSLKQGLESIDE